MHGDMDPRIGLVTGITAYTHLSVPPLSLQMQSVQNVVVRELRPAL